jgi:hypothetical protein
MKYAFLLCVIGCLSMRLVNAQSTSSDSVKESLSNWQMQSVSIGYAGENLIRPGMQFSADFIPWRKKNSELVLSTTAVFFVFRPFYTCLMTGGRARYQLHYPSGLTLRPIGIGINYKHKFLLAPVYEVNNGNVEKTTSTGYGNIHALMTSGLAYNFSDRSSIPLSLFADFGFSAEPYFGVYKFHYELFVGVSYHLK